MAKAREVRAQIGEELLLVRFPPNNHKAFVDPTKCDEPVCIPDGTRLRYMDLASVHPGRKFPVVGEADFYAASIGWDELRLEDGSRLILSELNAGLRVCVLKVPVEKTAELEPPPVESNLALV